MLKFRELDEVFAALADPSRRAMLERLTTGPATVTELARPLPMSLPAVVQHLHVLESSGLITTHKVGRVRTCKLELTTLGSAERWIRERKQAWEDRLDRLGEYLDDQADNPTAKQEPPA